MQGPVPMQQCSPSTHLQPVLEGISQQHHASAYEAQLLSLMPAALSGVSDSAHEVAILGAYASIAENAT